MGRGIQVTRLKPASMRGNWDTYIRLGVGYGGDLRNPVGFGTGLILGCQGPKPELIRVEITKIPYLSYVT